MHQPTFPKISKNVIELFFLLFFFICTSYIYNNIYKEIYRFFGPHFIDKDAILHIIQMAFLSTLNVSLLGN